MTMGLLGKKMGNEYRQYKIVLAHSGTKSEPG